MQISIKKTAKDQNLIFSNTIKKWIYIFDNSELEINLETTSNDNYLKSHKIKSAITNNTLLNSFLLLKGNRDDLNEAKMEAYEDLTKENDSDKIYLLPSFEISKVL